MTDGSTVFLAIKKLYVKIVKLISVMAYLTYANEVYRVY